MGYRNLIIPRVIPKAEEANTVLRRPYAQMVMPERWAMTTSMAHYRRGPYCRGKASQMRLALM